MSMDKIDDGGPAFPLRARENGSIFERSSEGMSLRDHFAGLAMQGLIAGQWRTKDSPGVAPPFSAMQEGFAAAAYAQADAMLQARKEKP